MRLTLSLTALLVVALAGCDAAGPDTATAIAADASENAATILTPAEGACSINLVVISTGPVSGSGQVTLLQTSSGQELFSCRGALVVGQAPDRAERLTDPFGFDGTLVVAPSGRFIYTTPNNPFL